MDIINIFLEKIIFMNMYILYPYSIIFMERMCEDMKCHNMIVKYQDFSRKNLYLYLFYNNLGKKYLKKFGVDPLFFDDISVLVWTFISMLDIDIYHSFWIVFFWKYGGDGLSYLIPAILLYKNIRV